MTKVQTSLAWFVARSDKVFRRGRPDMSPCQTRGKVQENRAYRTGIDFDVSTISNAVGDGMISNRSSVSEAAEVWRWRTQ